MKCPKCEKELPRGSKFCQYCGEKIPNRKHKNTERLFIASTVLFLITSAILGYSAWYYYEEFDSVQSQLSDTQKQIEVANDLIHTLSDSFSYISIINNTSNLRSRPSLIRNECSDRISDIENYFNSSVLSPESNVDCTYFVTPSGSKYHLSTCTKAKNADSLRGFLTTTAAEAAGYSPCAICIQK